MKFRQIHEGNSSSNMTPEEIAEKHGISVDMILSQLNKGINVEFEHTDDVDVATRIALDRLYEFPSYYEDHEAMEKSSMTEAKIETLDGATFKSPKEAYKAMLSNGSDEDEIRTVLPNIKEPAHKYYLRVAQKELSGSVIKSKKKKVVKKVKSLNVSDVKKKLKPKSNNIKYHKNISFENAKKLFDKAGDKYSEFIVGPTDKSEFVAFHTTDEDWNGMDYGYIDQNGNNDTWGQESLNKPNMKNAKSMGIKWILDELVVTDHDTPYEPAYPRKRFVVFESKDHRGDPLFVTIDGGTFIKAMPIPKGWKDGQPATFEEY